MKSTGSNFLAISASNFYKPISTVIKKKQIATVVKTTARKSSRKCKFFTEISHYSTLKRDPKQATTRLSIDENTYSTDLNKTLHKHSISDELIPSKLQGAPLETVVCNNQRLMYSEDKDCGLSHKSHSHYPTHNDKFSSESPETSKIGATSKGMLLALLALGWKLWHINIVFLLLLDMKNFILFIVTLFS